MNKLQAASEAKAKRFIIAALQIARDCHSIIAVLFRPQCGEGSRKHCGLSCRNGCSVGNNKWAQTVVDLAAFGGQDHRSRSTGIAYRRNIAAPVGLLCMLADAVKPVHLSIETRK